MGMAASQTSVQIRVYSLMHRSTNGLPRYALYYIYYILHILYYSYITAKFSRYDLVIHSLNDTARRSRNHPVKLLIRHIELLSLRYFSIPKLGYPT